MCQEVYVMNTTLNQSNLQDLTQESEELCAAEGNLKQEEDHSEYKEAMITSCYSQGRKLILSISPFAFNHTMFCMTVSVHCLI